MRLWNEVQLTHFPCSPALSTSCLFTEPHVSLLPQQDSFCYSLASWNLEKPSQECRELLTPWMQTCHRTSVILLGRDCLLLSFWEEFSLGVQCSSIGDGSSDSEPEKRKRSSIPHSVLNWSERDWYGDLQGNSEAPPPIIWFSCVNHTELSI